MPFVQIQPTQKQQLDASTMQLINAMKSHCKKQYELAWKKRVNGQLVDKTVAEAQALCDEFGVKAVQAFDLHAALQDLIYAADETWTPLVPPHNYVKNQDGTVTISAAE